MRLDPWVLRCAISSHAPLSQPISFLLVLTGNGGDRNLVGSSPHSLPNHRPFYKLFADISIRLVPHIPSLPATLPILLYLISSRGGQCIKSPQREREYIITRPQHRDNAKLYSKCYVAISIPDIFHPLLEAFSAKRSPYFAASEAPLVLMGEVFP